MKRFFFILLLILLLSLGGGIAFVKYYLLDPAFLKTQLSEQSLAHTGRSLQVNGDLSLALFPFAVEAKDVTLSNAKGVTPDHMMAIKELSLHVDIIPLLLKRQLSVTTIALHNPDIYLSKNKYGNANWEFTANTTKAKTTEPTEDNASAPLALSISHLLIDNGTIHFTDHQTNTQIVLEDFDAKGSLGEGVLPLTLSGTLKGLTPKAIAFSVESLIRQQGDAITLTNTAISFNNSDIRTEKMLIDMGGKTPTITGDISSNRLDLNSLIADTQTSKTSSPSSSENRAWSKEPIDFSLLTSLNLQSRITIGQFKAKAWDIEDIDTRITLAEGKLENKLSIGELLGGKLNANSTINAHSRALSAEYQLVDIALDDMPDNQKFKGTLNHEGALATKGRNQSEFMQNLSGKGELIVKDGAITGINILDMLRNVTGSFGAQKEAVTVFSTLSGTYTITDGVLVNDDLRMVQKKVDITGEGIVDLGNQRIKYRITPNVAVKLEEATATKVEETGNLRIPVLVRGSLWNPTFAPDLKALMPDVRTTINDVLRDPKNAGNILENAIKEPSGDIGKNLEGLGKNLQEGLLGGF